MEQVNNIFIKSKNVFLLRQAENELRLSQSEFDRQAEISKLLMEGLSQSQTNHVRHLKAFVGAQVEYYAQAHLVMQDLNRELNRSDTDMDRLWRNIELN